MANKALDFDMIDDLVTVPAHASIANIFDGGGTAEVWIKADSDGEGNSGRIVDKVYGTGWLLHVWQESAGVMRVLFYQSFTTTIGGWYTTDREVTVGSWTYIAVTYNNDSVDNDPIISINGSVVGITDFGIPAGTRVDDTSANLAIGNTAEKDRTFEGIIDEVRLSTTIRTPTEISNTWNGGSGVRFAVDGDTVALWHIDEDDGTIFDETDNNNDGTIDGATWVDGFPFNPLARILRIRLGDTTYGIQLVELT